MGLIKEHLTLPESQYIQEINKWTKYKTGWKTTLTIEYVKYQYFPKVIQLPTDNI
jgi:hypothetical protein